MPRPPSSKNFLRLFQTSDKDLFSEMFYDAMDRESEDLHNYYEKCNNIDVRKPKDKMILICKQYQRFLDKCLEWSVPNSQYNISLLLSYWLYEKLKNIYGDNNPDEINIGFGALQGIWGTFPGRPRDDTYYIKCKPELYMVDHKDWKNRKKLYDYYVDYDTLYNMGRFHDKGCKYYKKIEDKKSLYDHFAHRCSSEGGDCPEFYKQCEPYNPKNVLSDLQCYAEMQNQIVDTRPLAQSPEAGRDSTGLQASAASTQDTQLTSKSSDIGTKVSHTVLGTAPVLLTATALYRYTPLGPWIRRFGGGRTNGMNAMDTFSPYTPETGDMFSNDAANYIAYQPI